MLNLFRTSLMSRNFSTLQGPLFFRASPILFAEPLKKKKRIDPMIIKQREERKRKRLEKMIRRLEKGARQEKPIDECEVPEEIINERASRIRQLKPPSEEIQNQRILLLKQWTSYSVKQHLADIKMCDRLVLSQQWALDQLKSESEELYNAAIQLDESLIPFRSKGPVETPPIESYDSPDGEYIDISKKWDN